MALCGGTGKDQPPDDQIREVCAKVKDEILSKTAKKSAFDIVTYKTQVNLINFTLSFVSLAIITMSILQKVSLYSSY